MARRIVDEDLPIVVTAVPVQTSWDIHDRLSRQLAHLGTPLERCHVWFEHVNDRRGILEWVCHLELTLAGGDRVRLEGRGGSVERAFAHAAPRIARAVEKAVATRRIADQIDAGEIIGRRVGHGEAGLTRALERPEKLRRDAYVDTSQPGTSATDRKAGGPTTARRNSRKRMDRTTVFLEDSRTRPSRKSTRRSANRGKPSQGIERAVVARVTTPAHRAQARRI
ncbi:MAG TPA: hypothetical protein VM734_21260 [Kofleriaceae bacterium]|jgi:hypothetical protein|nr:hypothetical protein [Kofleriaceae bacterium]